MPPVSWPRSETSYFLIFYTSFFTFVTATKVARSLMGLLLQTTAFTLKFYRDQDPLFWTFTSVFKIIKICKCLTTQDFEYLVYNIMADYNNEVPNSLSCSFNYNGNTLYNKNWCSRQTPVQQVIVSCFTVFGHFH